jgi:hypothetical protein
MKSLQELALLKVSVLFCFSLPLIFFLPAVLVNCGQRTGCSWRYMSHDQPLWFIVQISNGFPSVRLPSSPIQILKTICLYRTNSMITRLVCFLNKLPRETNSYCHKDQVHNQHWDVDVLLRSGFDDFGMDFGLTENHGLAPYWSDKYSDDHGWTNLSIYRFLLLHISTYVLPFHKSFSSFHTCF